MQHTNTPGERPLGQTEGSAQRSSHDVRGTATTFNYLTEAAALRREPAWQQGDRNAKTLVKEADLRVVLTALKQGTVVREHRVPGTAMVQTITGTIRVRFPDQVLELPAGHIAILGRDLPHDAEAVEESAFLVTVAWSGEVRGDDAR